MDCKNCQDSSCPSRKQQDGENNKDFEERQRLGARLCKIKHKILVLSGKGGVGKSTVAVNLAATLAREGFKVGLMDVDIHGPSIPTMLNLTAEKAYQSEAGIEPVPAGPNLGVISVAFFLKDMDQAVIWRGPMKMAVIKQFLGDVNWGELDFLIIDSPPGTGDEPLSVCQLIPELSGCVMVTTPQQVASADVRRSISFCKQLNVPVLGVIENMSGFKCPKCGEIVHVFSSGGGRKLAEEMDVPFLGEVPLDPAIAQAGDLGKPYIEVFAGSDTAEIFAEIVNPVISRFSENS